MFDAFADRVNVGIAGVQMVVDDHAAIAFESGRLGKNGIGADANRHDDDVSRQDAPVLELDAGDFSLSQDGLGIGGGVDFDAALKNGLLEQIAGVGIELALHQCRHQMHDRNLHALERQTRRRFEAEQSTADDHGMAAFFGRLMHERDVVEIAEGHHALEIGAGNRNDERLRTGGDDQLVIGEFFAGRRLDRFGGAVDGDHGFAAPQLDAMRGVPGLIVDDDVFKGLFARQHGRKHDAVVIDSRLRAENRYVQRRVVFGEKLFHGAAAGHAIADHHQLLMSRAKFCLSHGTPSNRTTRRKGSA